MPKRTRKEADPKPAEAEAPASTPATTETQGASASPSKPKKTRKKAVPKPAEAEARETTLAPGETQDRPASSSALREVEAIAPNAAAEAQAQTIDTFEQAFDSDAAVVAEPALAAAGIQEAAISGEDLAAQLPDLPSAPSDEVDEFTPAPRPPAKLERLQKILSQAGVASRRHAEELITQGRVQVNGKVVTELGSKADPERDHIRVDGKLLHGAERLRYFVLNKPRGYVTTVSDPEGRPTVMEFFRKEGERLYPVGRLDYQSEGLLLVTNDGDLANKLTKAATGVEKTYLVKVSGQPTEEQLDRLREGVAIERGKPGDGRVRTAPAVIRQIRSGDNPWYEVVLIEGRNRELRKMFEEIGHHVEKIRRVGYGPLVLDQEPGHFRELEPDEIARLRLAAEGKLVKPKATQPKPQRFGADRQAGGAGSRRRERPFERPEASPRPKGRFPDRPFGREERPGKRYGAFQPAKDRPRPERRGERPPQQGEGRPQFDRGGFSDRGGFREKGAGAGRAGRTSFEGTRPQRPRFERRPEEKFETGQGTSGRGRPGGTGRSFERREQAPFRPEGGSRGFRGAAGPGRSDQARSGSGRGPYRGSQLRQPGPGGNRPPGSAGNRPAGKSAWKPRPENGGTRSGLNRATKPPSNGDRRSSRHGSAGHPGPRPGGNRGGRKRF